MIMVAILNPDILSDLRMSIDEYLSADFPEGHRYELVKGVVEMSPIPDIPHDRVVNKLHRWLMLSAEGRPDVVGYMSQRFAVTISTRETAREPDFGVYGPAESPLQPGRKWRDLTPMLVIEVVSQGQEPRDYDDKRRDYWDAGVSEYWIADPQRKTLTVLSRHRVDWAEQVFSVGDAYHPANLPGLEIPVDELFRI
jgi:Uma2 family endonuclease